MIPKQENVKVFSNSSNEKGFTINASREAFRILSSGLYSNKPQAIIRELSCNAYDSHVMAGYPERPFKIHLPDAWEPFLSIEDFGIGLDDDDINNIYTSYFTSTKTNSNDVIGGLGLGSKTPFSYTDTFTIRTRKDAVERVYNAYVSEAGSPTVSLMSELDTNEPNGVLITVPIRNADFYDFAREANKIYEYFQVTPEGWTGDNKVVRDLEEGHGLLVNSYNPGNVTVVMGNVAYKIQVNETIIPLDRKRAWSFLNKSSLVVRFDIGDLTPAANRETISFDDESKAVFIDKIENIVNNYYEGFQKDVDDCPTVLEALNYVDLKIGVWAWNILDYKGLSLYDWSTKNVLEEIRAIIDPDNLNVEGELRILTRGYSNQLSTNVLIDKYGQHKINYKSLCGDKIIFFMDDTDHGRGYEATSRSYLRQEYEKHEILLRYVLSDYQIDALELLLGDSFKEAVLLSEIKEKMKVVREKVKAAAGPRKDPVVRAKKNEIRVDCWTNDNSSPYYEERQLVDIDELSNKRVGHIESIRGYSSETPILGRYPGVSTSNLVYYCKLFKLDYIVITRPAQTEKVKERMPFLITLSDLELKDVKDNEVAFLYSTLAKFKDSLKSFSEKLDSNNFASKIDTLIFDRHYRNSYESPVILSKKVINFVEIPEVINEVLAVDLINKLQDAMEVFNEDEIQFSSECVESASGYDMNPWGLIYEKYTTSIAESIFERNKIIAEKYPLIVFLSSEIYYEKENLIEYVNEYIQLIHEKSLMDGTVEPFNEAMAEIKESLYEEIA